MDLKDVNYTLTIKQHVWRHTNSFRSHLMQKAAREQQIHRPLYFLKFEITDYNPRLLIPKIMIPFPFFQSECLFPIHRVHLQCYISIISHPLLKAIFDLVLQIFQTVLTL